MRTLLPSSSPLSQSSRRARQRVAVSARLSGSESNGERSEPEGSTFVQERLAKELSREISRRREREARPWWSSEALIARLPPSSAAWLERNALAVRLPRDLTELLLPGAAWSASSLLALSQGFSHTVGDADPVPALPLALCFGATLYHLRQEKKASLPRAAVLTLLGLLVGTGLGTVVENVVRVDLAPLGNFSSPAVLVSEGALAGIFAVWLVPLTLSPVTHALLLGCCCAGLAHRK